MPQERMVIAQRRDTAALARDTGRTTTRLPDELLNEQVRRIGLFGVVIGGLWTLGLFIDIVMAPYVWGVSMSMRAVWLEVTGIAARHADGVAGDRGAKIVGAECLFDGPQCIPCRGLAGCRIADLDLMLGQYEPGPDHVRIMRAENGFACGDRRKCC